MGIFTIDFNFFKHLKTNPIITLAKSSNFFIRLLLPAQSLFLAFELHGCSARCLHLFFGYFVADAAVQEFDCVVEVAEVVELVEYCLCASFGGVSSERYSEDARVSASVVFCHVRTVRVVIEFFGDVDIARVFLSSFSDAGAETTISC